MQPAAPSLANVNIQQLWRTRPAEETELVTWTFTNDSGEKELTEPTQMRLRSLHSLQHSRVNFVNKTNSVVRAMWINFDGDEVAYSLIEPNTTKRYSTYATHPWVVRNVETGKRMMLNNSVVAVAAPEQKDIIIGEVPMLHWQRYVHTAFPEDFKATVREVLRCHHRLRTAACKAADSAAGSSPELSPVGDAQAHPYKTRSVTQRSLMERLCLWMSPTRARTVPISAPEAAASALSGRKRSAEMALASGPLQAIGQLPTDLVWLVVHHMAPSDVHQDTSKPGAHPDIQPAMLPEVAPQTIAGGAGVAAIMHLHLNQVLPQAHQPAQHPAQPQVQQQ